MQSLDELETAVAHLIDRVNALSSENEALRREVAERRERMQAASQRLRLVADRLPAAVGDENEARAA